MVKASQAVRVAAAVYSSFQECLLSGRKETEKKSTFFLRKVRYHFRSPSNGVLAQLVERLNGIEEVRGSNPLGSKLGLLARGSERLRLAGQTSRRQQQTFRAESDPVGFRRPLTKRSASLCLPCQIFLSLWPIWPHSRDGSNFAAKRLRR